VLAGGVAAKDPVGYRPTCGVQSTSRTIATVIDGRARLQSRHLLALTRHFPDVTGALGTWFRDFVLDGVIWGRRRRVQNVGDGAALLAPKCRGLLIFSASTTREGQGATTRSTSTRLRRRAQPVP
jgi:hypothetical protein